MLPIHIRWLINRDLPEILDIEFDNFEYPWYEEDFIKAMRNRKMVGMVAECQEKIIGYFIFEFNKTYLTLLNLSVHSDFWRQEVGTRMVEKLITKMGSRRRIKVNISDDNTRAHLFFKKLGFRSLKVIKNFYEENRRDAYMFLYKQKQLVTC